MAARERGNRDAVAESRYVYGGAEHEELQWGTSIQREGVRKYGITGFAGAISRSRGAAVYQPYLGARLCKHSPCQADWKDDGKSYGI